jgi:hypothetical protein
MARPRKSVKKIGRPTAFRTEYVEQAFKLCLLGATDAEMGAFFDVSEQTVNAWKKAQPAFLESIKRGKSKADTAVAGSLYHRALGYDHEAVKIFCDKDGNITEAPYTERYPPDTTAAIFWLKNRQPANWRDRKEITGGDGGPLAVVVQIVREGRKVTSG